MMSRRHFLASGTAAFAMTACQSRGTNPSAAPHIEMRSRALLDVMDPEAPLETLSTGYGWSEGPAWDRTRNVLYFTDVPGNTAWVRRGKGPVEVFLSPSGAHDVEGFREPGANGLWARADGSLILCNHGLRRIELLNPDTGERTPLASQFEGQRFNSPNDVVQARDGTIWFTDPPYGLDGLDASPLKEMEVNGVYRMRPDGRVQRILSDMTFPNGIALSPDETRLYVSQSDPSSPLIRELTLDPSGDIVGDRTLLDATPLLAENAPGLPDGMAVAASGHIFATGPGGVLVLTPDGELIGRILTSRATANCCFGEDGRTLYITAHDRLMSIRTRALGIQWT